GMAGGAAQVQEPALSQHDDSLAAGPDDVIDLRLDLIPLQLGQGGDLDFTVEMADIADDGVVLHLVHVNPRDHVHVAGGGDEDVAEFAGVVHGDDLEAFHAGLQRADRIDLGDVDGGASGAKGLGTALADVAVAADDRLLTADHDVGCSLYAINKTLAA